MRFDNSEETSPTNPDIGVLRIQLEHAREKFEEKKQELLQTQQLLDQVRRELERTKDELTNLKIERAQEQVTLTTLTTQLVEKEQKVIKKNSTAKLQAFLAGLLYLLSTILATIGINLITSKPPDSIGFAMIALAVIIYIIAAFMTTLLAVEGS
jgi:hypothetical protein